MYYKINHINHHEYIKKLKKKLSITGLWFQGLNRVHLLLKSQQGKVFNLFSFHQVAPFC